jgi:hypothetical protein
MRKAYAIACGVTPVLLLLLCAVPGTAVAQQNAALQQTEPQKTPAPPPRAVIPVAEVATQATGVSNLLRTLSAQFAPSPAIETIHKVLPEVSGTVALLETVASAHPQVLRAPPPQALFLGYGDSGINFELRAWLDFNHWAQVRSDLAVAVYDAVYAAGMTFPVPQREVRVLRNAEGEFTTAPVNAARTIERADKCVETETHQRQKEVM